MMKWSGRQFANLSVSCRSAALQGGRPGQGDGLFALSWKTIYFWKRWWVSHPSSFIFSFKKKKNHLEGNLSFIWPLCCFPGALAFFFFTRKIPIFQEEVPSLNYFWVPPLVRNTVSSAAFYQHWHWKAVCSTLTILQVSLNVRQSIHSAAALIQVPLLFVADGDLRILPDRAWLFQRLCHVCGHVVPVLL